MSYYAAGDYYAAGGFSFRKLGRFIGKVAKNPLIGVATSFLPGGGLVGAIGGLVGSPFGSALGAAASELAGGGGRHAMAAAPRGTPVTRHMRYGVRRTRRRLYGQRRYAGRGAF